MMRMPSVRTAGLFGVIGCAAGLLLAALDAKAAAAGWLVGFVVWSSVPLGALLLRLMTRVIPGAWREEVAPIAEMLVMLLPLTAPAVLPVLIGGHLLYPWMTTAVGEGFRGVYLSAWFFDLRSILFLIGAIVLGFLMATRPAWSLPLAAGGLIAFVLFDAMIAVDWLMSLEPDFHSSGFGLYELSVQASIALMVIAVIRLVADPANARPPLLGALMLAMLLLWAYFAFMQYFIIWSENLPKQVAWFQERGSGIWAAAEYAFCLLDLAPTFLLFFTAIRHSRRWLLAIAAAVLLAKAIEVAWLVFPAVHPSLAVSTLAAILALLGLGLLSVAFLGWVGRGSRLPSPGPAQ
jgi:hypothetical protein